MWAFEKRNIKLEHGVDFLIYGNIPNGSGLSSSASLEVLTGLMLKDMFGVAELSMQDLALDRTVFREQFQWNELWYYGLVCKRHGQRLRHLSQYKHSGI